MTAKSLFEEGLEPEDYVDLPGMPPQEYPLTKSLFKSVYQKNVRRNRPMQAMRSALAHCQLDVVDFTRRTPIVCIEDAIIHPKFPDAINAMMYAAKEKKITNDGLNAILCMIHDSAATNTRDYFTDDVTEPPPSMQLDVPRLGEEAQRYIKGLLIRQKFGGMEWDKKMLGGMARTWFNRFRDDEEHWLGVINDAYKDVAVDIDWKKAGIMERQDILLAAVDFHCSPIARILMKKDHVRNALASIGITDEQKQLEKVQDTIWFYRSAINKKVDISGKENIHPDDIPDKEALGPLWNMIKDECDSISRWYLQKQLEK